MNDFMRASIARSMQRKVDEMFMSAMSTTTANSAPQESLSKEKILDAIEAIKSAPPAPPAIKFLSDTAFPQEHFADEVVLIPHHPAHRFFAKLINKNAPTATVMRSWPLKRPICFSFHGTVYVPESMRGRFEQFRREGI